jgi:hypothetical protein
MVGSADVTLVISKSGDIDGTDSASAITHDR